MNYTVMQPISKGKTGYKIPKQTNKSFEEKILTHLRNKQTEYVAKFEQVQAIRALAEENETISVMQIDGMYELKMKRRK